MNTVGRSTWRGVAGWAAAIAVLAGGCAVPEFADEAIVAAPRSAAAPTATPASEPAPDPATAPTTAPSSATAPAEAERGTALAAVASLTVKGRAAKTGYSRDAFGQAWFDTDRNGCDTRNDILRRDLTDRTMKNSCKVLAGTRSPDPYTARTIRFEYGGASEIDIDHVVALSDAWQKGAGTWNSAKRLAFANDPLNLLAVDAGANRSKGDGDAATWLPPNKAYRCAYVSRQVAVKGKYGVWVTPAERDAMVRVLSSCSGAAAVVPGTTPTEAAGPKPRATATPKATPAPKPQATKAPAPASVFYQNCTAVRAAGAAPIRVGQPGYSRKLDRDGDGIGCE